MTALIEVEQLRKKFRVHRREAGLMASLSALFRRHYDELMAVDGISFDIKKGECVGFLGPNGAGKTTTLKMLAGLLYPTDGRVRVGGFTPSDRRRQFLESIMLVMGQKQQLIWDLPPVDTFELNRAIYAVPQRQFQETLDELINLLDLGDLVQKPTRELSLGERMKCELVAALIHRPKVLFLDEPTIGLDISTQVTVREFIRRYNERFEATVILTSHYMDDVAALCRRVIVIDRGRISFDGSLNHLVQAIRPEKRISLKFSADVSEAALESLGERVSYAPRSAVVQVSQERLASSVANALSTLPVQDLSVEAAPLEEVMRELFSKNAVENVDDTDA